MKSIYKELEEIVRGKGKRVNVEIPGLLSKKSAWVIGNSPVGDWLILLDEEVEIDEDLIVAIMDKTESFIYFSPSAVRGGIKKFLKIEDEQISSVQRLEEILRKIKER